MPENRDKVRINYYECNMTKGEHMLAYLVFVIAIAVILYVYYKSIIVALLGGIIIAIPQEKIYAKSATKKRQNKLRMQFNQFLEIISISVSGGSGRSMENAVHDSLRELKMMFNERADIVREIELIVSDYERAGIPMKDGFAELGRRSEIDDIMNFAIIYGTIEGKTSDFGYIITQTHEIIKDKAEITMEIETTISGAKSEAYVMLVLPLIIVIAMTSMGGELMGSLYTSFLGRFAATVGVVCTFASYIISTKATEIEV